MIIGKVNTGRKQQRLMVTILETKGSKMVDLRVYDIQQDGELMPTAAGVSVEPAQVDSVVELLIEAKKKATNGAQAL